MCLWVRRVNHVSPKKFVESLRNEECGMVCKDRSTRCTTTQVKRFTTLGR